MFHWLVSQVNLGESQKGRVGRESTLKKLCWLPGSDCPTHSHTQFVLDWCFLLVWKVTLDARERRDVACRIVSVNSSQSWAGATMNICSSCHVRNATRYRKHCPHCSIIYSADGDIFRFLVLAIVSFMHNIQMDQLHCNIKVQNFCFSSKPQRHDRMSTETSQSGSAPCCNLTHSPNTYLPSLQMTLCYGIAKLTTSSQPSSTAETCFCLLDGPEVIRWCFITGLWFSGKLEKSSIASMSRDPLTLTRCSIICYHNDQVRHILWFLF